jgi:hypothetical protein
VANPEPRSVAPKVTVGRTAFNDGGEGSHGEAGQHDPLITTEQAQAAFRSELTKYATLVKKLGLEPQ